MDLDKDKMVTIHYITSGYASRFGHYLFSIAVSLSFFFPTFFPSP